MIGCNNNPLLNECSNCYMDIDAPDLVLDNNGYYHMTHLNDYIQTFTTLRAKTGITDYYQKVKWVSNQEYYFGISKKHQICL